MTYVVGLVCFLAGAIIVLLILRQTGEPLPLSQLQRHKRYMRIGGGPVKDGSDELLFVSEANGKVRVIGVRVPSGTQLPLQFRIADKEGGGIEVVPVPLKA